MRDHNYIREDGTRIPVSQMTTDEIVSVLLDGNVQMEHSDGAPTDAVQWVLERLRIELLIRELSL
jgi:hypothetical protein